jgi:Heparinase II/III-like protein/Heparinase II/III N-terminus
MLSKLKLLKILWQNMGSRYILFRAQYEFKRKTGLLKSEYPTQFTHKSFISLEKWRNTAAPFFFSDKESLSFPKIISPELEAAANNILNGKIPFFSAEFRDLGKDYDWVTNPDSGYKYDATKHWTEINDFSQEAGDIKFVWEKSRFSYLYYLIRYDYHYKKDCSEFIFNEIESWLAANPLNCGPNYKCSQETSLRVFNWIFALYYYKNAPTLTEERFQKIINSIYGQIHHVYSNIDFSRIAVRNNHAITETLALYLVGLLMPFFPESEKWKTKGKQWFEEEIDYQIYDDGTFIQFSHNYHRVLIQLLTWGLTLAEANNERFKDSVYEKAKKSLNYLYQCQMLENGHLPNYGANDGALFFKLNDAKYRDYRPQLDALYHFFTKKRLYTEGSFSTLKTENFEDVNWYFNYKKEAFDTTFDLKQYSLNSFEAGGIYTIRNKDTFTFIKCATYKDRPSHADNLHIDVWYRGENILADSGTYKYNTDPKLVKYFSGTAGHNTVMLGDFDQMEKGQRFIWLNWAKSKTVSLKEHADYWEFCGRVDGFQQIGKDIFHERKVRHYKNRQTWEIEDTITHNTDLPMRQLWHKDPSVSTAFSIKTTDKNDKNVPFSTSEGYYSSAYGQKKSIEMLAFETTEPTLKTTLDIHL